MNSNQTIGIIGAGQLGLYMMQAAQNMGFSVVTYDPDINAPAHKYADTTFVNEFSDIEAFKRFYEKVDIITYEFENIDESVLKLGQDKIPQGIDLLNYSKHRFKELTLAQELGIPTIKSVYLKNTNHSKELSKLKLPLIQKTCQFGYDGKGQKICQKLDEIEVLEESLVSEYIKYDYEVSVILIRGKHNTTCFPLIKNQHKGGILETSIPTKDTESIAIEYAEKIADHTNYIGVMAVEFFVKDGKVIFNEIAPRPHNSGHYTLVGSYKSQFQLHIEAILGYELDQAQNIDEACVMLNVLGKDYLQAKNTYYKYENTHFYDYGKKGIKSDRKMGHIIFLGNEAYDNAEKFKEGEKNGL